MVKNLKKKGNKRLIISFIFLLILLLSLLFLNNNSINEVCFKEKCFKVEIANNEIERSQGLMFRQNLSENEGMLFIFPKEDNYSFWMKNTLIPLDIIWLDSSYKVVYIKENTPPCATKTCEAYTPDKKAKYVVEVNGGWVKKREVLVGDYFPLVL